MGFLVSQVDNQKKKKEEELCFLVVKLDYKNL